MIKEECELIIKALLENRSDGLLRAIHEGKLDIRKLDELGQAIGTLNALDLYAADRGRLSAILWEFAFDVSKHIGCHYNPMDIFFFKDVDQRKLSALSNMVYWLSNRFTYAKELEEEDLLFAGYMRWDGPEH